MWTTKTMVPRPIPFKASIEHCCATLLNRKKTKHTCIGTTRNLLSSLYWNSNRTCKMFTVPHTSLKHWNHHHKYRPVTLRTFQFYNLHISIMKTVRTSVIYYLFYSMWWGFVMALKYSNFNHSMLKFQKNHLKTKNRNANSNYLDLRFKYHEVDQQNADNIAHWPRPKYVAISQRISYELSRPSSTLTLSH